MKKLYSLLFLLIAFGVSLSAQIVTTTPEFPTETDEVTVVFDAAQVSALKGYTGSMYAHTGVNIKGGTAWKYAPAWDNNAAKYQLTSLGNDKWQLKITPDIRTYYGVQANETVEKMCFVFRSSDKTKQSQDLFVDVHKAGLVVRFDQPAETAAVEAGKPLTIQASASTNATLTIFVDNKQIATKQNTKELATTHTFDQAGTFELKVEANDGSGKATATAQVNVMGATQEATLPKGARPGINYPSDTQATLVLQAPGKKTVHLIGDFNDWQFLPAYQLKRDGEMFWLTIDNLEPGKEYAFQYLVDGNIRVADPYSEKILDPWNDVYIPEAVYPNLKAYPAGKTEGVVAVLQTAQKAYSWKVKKFEAPEKEHLIIYEMLIRDFTSEQTYKAAMNKLDYLQTLGVNAIELMPVQEFDGNNSWGYNPNYYFAPDKYYGTKNDLKAFVDECHSRGIAVLMDLVLNHSYGLSPFYLMYQNGSAPAADNPWHNEKSNIANPSLQFGFDFNHESTYTQALVDSVASFWMSEYKVDGFRYDFTKGFSNTPYPNTSDWASGYDAARIAILKRMASEVWKRNPDAYVIFEHLTATAEEKELAEAGVMLWRNTNHAYCQSAMGWSSESAFNGAYAGTSMPAGSLVSYMESHDEERMAYKQIKWGDGLLKTDLSTRMKQLATNASFFFTVPGPKMIWQFGERGYDISIDDGGRLGEKEPHWEYMDNTHRKELYDTYAKLINLRLSYPELFASDATFSWKVGTTNWANGRFITSKAGEKAVVVAGNFTMNEGQYAVSFPSTGRWYDYMSGESIDVTSTTQTVTVPAHEFRLYLNFEPAITGIEDSFVRENEPLAWYNRATDCIELSTPQPATIEVYNAGGMLVARQENTSSLGLSVVPPGYYIARVLWPDGSSERCKVAR